MLSHTQVKKFHLGWIFEIRYVLNQNEIFDPLRPNMPNVNCVVPTWYGQ
jgi:hypothetical protein